MIALLCMSPFLLTLVPIYQKQRENTFGENKKDKLQTQPQQNPSLKGSGVGTGEKVAGNVSQALAQMKDISVLSIVGSNIPGCKSQLCSLPSP